MSIDTKIDGDPASVRAAASWLRDSLASQLAASVDDLDRVTVLAEAGWDGEAGDAFAVKVRNTSNKTNDFVGEVLRYATELEELAGAIELAQAEMSAIRSGATSAGLEVSDGVIEKPADGDPDKLTAFNTAAQSAEQVRNRESFWSSTWRNIQNDLTNKWFLLIGDMVNGAAGALVVKHSSLLLQGAAAASSDALKALIEAKNAPVGTLREAVYRDMDWSRQQMARAGDLLDQSDNARSRGARIGFKLGGALAAAGIAYDIYNGKPTEQAVVSGLAGFGASVATGAGVGALVGSVVPGPGNVVGAAAGTVVGAAVGIFTSGAVDSLYEDGLSVGGAVNSGIDALESTGAAIGSGVSKAWNAIF
ncbi:hypothetical protein IU436_06265 [Nocardia farcinica]|uniref:hypothetical protein n=1 Tax=Nocardia farcinica TaxID=37329 RepID=UPI001892DBDD|nr:hypothetical protein [Nocardia farcinica]MBF6418474.1 hypothetical protein [Nocardia farcinica]MBF6429951.1 hypothetical protein [Nocardia farcinica]MBF6500817.1 hypothetical protein [Nocardia farcinica]